MYSAFDRRVRANFFLKDRLAEYQSLLRLLADLGFLSLTLRDLALSIRDGTELPRRRVLLRHDIDTDPGYVDRWLAAERQIAFQASYYFRLRTIDVSAMRRIEAGGGEASYHFEELSSVARRRGMWKPPVKEELLKEARCEFEQNFCALQRRFGSQMLTVAAHGDFVNRKLGVTNSIITNDPALRSRLGILAEAYDEEIVNMFEARFSDCMGKKWRSDHGLEPHSVVQSGIATIQILTHPRHWRASISANLWEDADRIISAFSNLVGLPVGGFVDYVNKRRQLTD